MTTLEKLLKLMKKKFGHSPMLILHEDGSGRITSNFLHPYETTPMFEFGNISQLLNHLQETKQEIEP